MFKKKDTKTMNAAIFDKNMNRLYAAVMNLDEVKSVLLEAANKKTPLTPEALAEQAEKLKKNIELLANIHQALK